MFRIRHEERRGHFLGHGLRFVGDVRGGGDLVCEAQIEGTIELDGTVQIGPHGTVRGGIKAREVDIAGSVEGDVVTRGRVTLRASCTLKGGCDEFELTQRPLSTLLYRTFY